MLFFFPSSNGVFNIKGADMMSKKLSVIFLAMVLAGCFESEAKFDTSNTETYKESLAKVRESMPPEERPQLDVALRDIVTAEASIKAGADAYLQDNEFAKSLFSGLVGNVLTTVFATNPDKAAEMVLAVAAEDINGKTGHQVIRVAKEKELERLTAQAARLKEDMDSLPKQIEKVKRQSAKYKDMLKRIEITDAKYYWAEDSFIAKPVIDFKIKNNLDVAVGRVFFHGLLETPGRSIPWLDDTFNYEIKGGLEPGEQQHLRLAPNMFGNWGDEDLKGLKNTIFTVNATDAEVAGGDRLVPRDLGDVDDLKEKLADTQKAYDKLSKRIDALQADVAN